MSDFPADLTGTWTIDPAHSHLAFGVRHALVATVRGSFNSYSGGAIIDAEAPERSSLWLDVDAASFTTGHEQRDGHVKSADFLNVEEFPTISFKSTGVVVKGEEIVATGDLTVRGVARQVEVRWEFSGIALDPMGNRRAGFEGSTVINRKDFGVLWNAPLEAGGVLVGEKVKLSFDISAIKS